MSIYENRKIRALGLFGSIASILALLLAISTDMFGLQLKFFGNSSPKNAISSPVTSKDNRNGSDLRSGKEEVKEKLKDREKLLKVGALDCKKLITASGQIPYTSRRSSTLHAMVKKISDTNMECAFELAKHIPYTSTRNSAFLFLSDKYLERGLCEFAQKIAKKLPYTSSRSSQLSKISLAMADQKIKCQ